MAGPPRNLRAAERGARLARERALDAKVSLSTAHRGGTRSRVIARGGSTHGVSWGEHTRAYCMHCFPAMVLGYLSLPRTDRRSLGDVGAVSFISATTSEATRRGTRCSGTLPPRSRSDAGRAAGAAPTRGGYRIHGAMWRGPFPSPARSIGVYVAGRWVEPGDGRSDGVQLGAYGGAGAVCRPRPSLRSLSELSRVRSRARVVARNRPTQRGTAPCAPYGRIVRDLSNAAAGSLPRCVLSAQNC